MGDCPLERRNHPKAPKILPPVMLRLAILVCDHPLQAVTDRYGDYGIGACVPPPSLTMFSNYHENSRPVSKTVHHRISSQTRYNDRSFRCHITAVPSIPRLLRRVRFDGIK